jgi:DNA-binding transcriptional LysR family regulator
MQLETLRLFIDLVEAGSFSLAAAKHRITQSAVSQRIASLEKELGVRLLVRGRSAEPTPEGTLLLESAHRILATHDDFLRQLHELHRPVRGILRISTIYSIGLHELPPYLKWFRDHYPQVDVEVAYHRSDQVYREVASGRADLGFVAYPDCRDCPDLVCDTFWQDELVVVFPPGHPLDTGTPVPLRALHGVRFIAFQPDLPTRKAIDALFAGAGVRVDERMALDNVELVKRAVELEQAAAIVPQRTVYAEVRGGRLAEAALEAPHGDTTRPLGMVWRRAAPGPSPAVKEFTDLLRHQRLF